MRVHPSNSIRILNPTLFSTLEPKFKITTKRKKWSNFSSTTSTAKHEAKYKAEVDNRIDPNFSQLFPIESAGDPIPQSKPFKRLLLVVIRRIITRTWPETLCW